MSGKVKIGGIIKFNGSPGFKLVFPNLEEARKYKEMFMYILKSDKFDVELGHGYLDVPKEERDSRYD